MLTRLGRLGVLSILALSAFACTRDPKALTERHVARGDRYLAEKKYGDAIIEYRTALSYSPSSGETHLKLAETHMANDDLRSAYPEFLRAADGLPDSEDAQLKAGNLLLMAGKYQDAKTRARAALKKNPKNVAALVLLGNALAGLKDLESAVELSQQAALLEPKRSGIYRNMGVFQLARGEVDLAERAFKRALEVDPKSVSACLSLAELYRISRARQSSRSDASSGARHRSAPRHGESGDGIVLRPQRPRSRSRALLENGLRTGEEHRDRPVARRLLSGDGRRTDSVEVLKGILTLKDGFASATTRLAAIEFSAGRKANGYKLLEDVLKLNPKHVPALAVKTRFFCPRAEPTKP